MNDSCPFVSLGPEEVGSINIQSCDLRFVNGAPIQSVLEILVCLLDPTRRPPPTQ